MGQFRLFLVSSVVLMSAIGAAHAEGEKGRGTIGLVGPRAEQGAPFPPDGLICVDREGNVFRWFEKNREDQKKFEACLDQVRRDLDASADSSSDF